MIITTRLRSARDLAAPDTGMADANGRAQMSSTGSIPESDSSSEPIARRTLLNATLTTSLAAAGTMLISEAASAATARQNPATTAEQGDFVDVSRPERRTVLRLRLDESPGAHPVAVPLTLGTAREETTRLTITSTTGRTGVGTTAVPVPRSGTVVVSVTQQAPVVLWVTPLQTGPPLVAADILTITTPDGDIPVEVWIQPQGGRWTPAGPNGEPLDLEIVAMHAALMRRPGNSDVVMWSMPRTRDSDGNPAPDRRPERRGQWMWWKFRLNDVESRVLDVSAGTTSETPLPTFADAGGPRVDNIFCAGAAHLPNGDLLVVGGHMAMKNFQGVNIEDDNAGIIENADHLYVYNASRRQWRKLEYTFPGSRWYPTVTALPDGRMLIISGSSSLLEGNEHDHSAAGFWASIANDYFIFNPKDEEPRYFAGPLVNQRELGITASGHQEVLATYPNVFVLPKPGTNGAMIAMAETNRGWLYDYQPGNKTQPVVGGNRAYRMTIAGSRSYPTYGSMVLLPITPQQTTMRILAVGGQGGATPDHHDLDADQPSTDAVDIFEVDTAKPADDPSHRWRQPISGDKLASSRVLCDATLLADGTVLISGGSRTGWGDLNRHPVLDAELFDPATETIRPASRACTDRRYHSTALLLLDGTLLKAGSSGGFGNVSDDPNADLAHRNEIDDQTGQPWMTVHTTAERYWPPYLFAGPRPTIVGIHGADDGTALKYNTQFTVDAVGDGLDDRVRAALIRLGSTTHGNDMDQRYIWLDAAITPAGTAKRNISLSVPANSAAAPPGDYQLVIVDRHGVPSPGRLVRMKL
jgi:hypothetical protein